VRDLAFVAAWIVLLPLALQGAQLGVLLWTWTSLLAPNDVLYGFGADLPYAKIAAVLTLGLMLARRGGDIRMQCNATVMLMMALALCGLASQAGALAVDPASGWDLCAKFGKILLLGIVVTAVMRDRLRLHALLLVICLGIGFTGLGEGAKFLLSAGGHKIQGTPSTGDNNQIGINVLLIMPMLYYLYATGATRILRLVCLAMCGMSLVCIVATASRAAFLGLAVLAVVFVLSSRRKVLGLLVVGALAVVGSQFVSRAWVDRMNTIESAESDESFMGRVGAWKVSAAVAFERPVFGGGFHAIQEPDVWRSHLEAADQVDIFGLAPPSPYPRAAHSVYFEVLGDLGFGGLTLFLALFGVAWRNAVVVRRLVRRSLRPDLAWAGSLAGALQASILVFLIGGATLSASYYDIDYLLVAMVCALRELVERTMREPAPLDLAALIPASGRVLAPPVFARRA
jgi:putative inorganic carbon (HCO3(-)) transporter